MKTVTLSESTQETVTVCLGAISATLIRCPVNGKTHAIRLSVAEMEKLIEAGGPWLPKAKRLWESANDAGHLRLVR